MYANLDWEKAKTKLITSIRIAFATRYIQKTKLTLIGYQAPGFVDFHPNPFEMSRQFGSLLQQVGLTEYVTTALDAITDDEVNADIDYVLNDLKLPFKDPATGFGADKSDLPLSSRHYLAMKKLVNDNNFDALAIRCWPELQGPQVVLNFTYLSKHS